MTFGTIQPHGHAITTIDRLHGDGLGPVPSSLDLVDSDFVLVCPA